MLRELMKFLFDKRLHMKRKQEKKYIRELKNGKIVHLGAKNGKNASEEPKTGEKVHQELEKRKDSTSGN